MSANKKTFLQIYHEAIKEPYSLFNLNLVRDKSTMFMETFTQYLTSKFHIFICYIIATFTNSEGFVIRRTNSLLGSIFYN